MNTIGSNDARTGTLNGGAGGVAGASLRRETFRQLGAALTATSMDPSLDWLLKMDFRSERGGGIGRERKFYSNSLYFVPLFFVMK